jgi:hopanoid-associated phosphorylase
MGAAQPALLIVTGLAREAQIAAGEGVVTLCSGGRPALLRERLTDFFVARPHEGGDPEQQARAILSFGLCGGLAPHLQPGDLVVASQVIAGTDRYEADANWAEAIASALGDLPRVHRGALAGSDSVVAETSGKTRLHATTHALAVDMESHVAADYARRHHLPFAVIRAVSDPSHRSLPEIAHRALRPDGSVDLMGVIGGVVRKPAQVAGLIAAGQDSGRAFASLRRVRGLLGPLFGLGGAHL